MLEVGSLWGRPSGLAGDAGKTMPRMRQSPIGRVHCDSALPHYQPRRAERTAPQSGPRRGASADARRWSPANSCAFMPTSHLYQPDSHATSASTSSQRHLSALLRPRNQSKSLRRGSRGPIQAERSTRPRHDGTNAGKGVHMRTRKLASPFALPTGVQCGRPVPPSQRRTVRPRIN
jgi:hypothetical protein